MTGEERAEFRRATWNEAIEAAARTVEDLLELHGATPEALDYLGRRVRLLQFAMDHQISAE